MKANRSKNVIGKFPLRLMPSVRERAEEFSRQEGVSLNQFINLAVAEKLVVFEHQAWLASRPKPTSENVARALAALDRPTANAPDAGDELPAGYQSVRKTRQYKQAAGRVGK